MTGIRGATAFGAPKILPPQGFASAAVENRKTVPNASQARQANPLHTCFQKIYFFFRKDAGLSSERRVSTKFDVAQTLLVGPA